ncbi:MAG: FRG domain-containing protein [Segetibacter sp.]
MKENYIKSVSDFIEVTLKITKNLGTERVAWFRGEDCEEYKLVPNLFRKTTNNRMPYCSDIIGKEIYKIEQNIDVSFNRKATVFLSNKRIQNSDWNRYFLKQHYGVKTRLLYWTENAFIALFFAINNNEKKNGKVSILSPTN